MKEITIERAASVGSVPVYRLTVDGRLLLRHAPMRVIVETLEDLAKMEKTTPQPPTATAPLAQGSRREAGT